MLKPNQTLEIRYNGDGYDIDSRIDGVYEGSPVNNVSEEMAENIVKALTNHAALVQALKAARVPIADDCASFSTHRKVLEKIDAALAAVDVK